MALPPQALRSRVTGRRPGGGLIRAQLDGEFFIQQADGFASFLAADGTTWFLQALKTGPAQRTPVTGSYAILPTDTLVALTGSALATGPTWTLPTAASYDPRQTLYTFDETGLLSDSLLLTIAVVSSDVIVTGGNVPSMTMGSAGQKLAWHSDGVGRWTYG